MNIGDLVNNEKKNRLYCGGRMYPHAVVMLKNPLVLVSEGTDMLWTGLDESDVSTTSIILAPLTNRKINRLNKGCKQIIKLCRITQAQIDERGTTLIDAYRQVAAQHKRHNTWNSPLTWGGDDGKCLMEQLHK